MTHPGTQLTDEEDLILYRLSVFHLIFNGLYVLMTIVYICIISQRAMHLNVKILFMHIPIPYLVNSFVQSWFRVNYFLDIPLGTPDDFSVCVSDAAAFGNFYNMNVLIVERVIATMKVSNYEKYDSTFPTTGFCLILLQWIISFWTFYLAHVPGLFKFIVCVIAFVNTTIVITMFITLPIITKRIHDNFRATYDNKLKFSNIWNVTLTERYQSTENLRLAHLVNTLLIIELFSSIVELITHMLVRMNPVLSLNWFLFLIMLYIGIGIESIILMLVILFGTISPVQKRRRLVQVGSALTPEAINRLYFETYERAWA